MPFLDSASLQTKLWNIVCLLICETTTLLKSVSKGRSLEIMLTKKDFKSSPLWLSASAFGEHGQKSHLDGDRETKAPDWGEIIP